MERKAGAWDKVIGYTVDYTDECRRILYYANAREYDSRSGSFLTRDRLSYIKYEEPNTLNLYQYVQGNPLRYTDYSGHECIEEKSYMQRTAEMVVYGSFSDEFTLLGLGIQVVLGIVGVDAPMDVRDLAADLTVNFNITSFSWWGTVVVDVIALIPVIGAVKYVDELGTGMKALFKNGDELGAGGKGILKNGDEIAGGAKKSSEILDAVNDVLKRGSGKADDINRHIGELVDNAQKNLDDFKGGLEGGSGSVQTISNKFPNDNQAGKRFNYTTENGRVHIENGVQNVDFVIDMDGNLHIGRGHSYLAGGSSVQAAGTMKVNSQGYIRLITNESGHFQPTTVQAMNYPTVFRNAGLNIDNAWIRIGEFETSMSNYVIDSKVFYNGPIKNMP